ncbi:MULTISPECIES: Crp/Fnr family transcriptional regulator [unclassified Sphingomonas]|uniref:Crp/Fnr family transcriptional regulator n=1 Tax=unclassified Sphingomonas TaxID=196159 RepID=UPI000A3E2193|nr:MULTISPECIES: helix-turn-helix domain-containing protein [unclassified Sphingomonas]
MMTLSNDVASHSHDNNTRTGENRLLAALSTSDRALLEPGLERVRLAVGDTLLRVDQPIEHVYFLEGGIAAVLEVIEGERQHAVGLLGADGYVGWPILLGDDRSPHDVVLRAEPGTALRIPAARLLEAVERSDTLRAPLLRFIQVFLIQMGRTVVSALSHPVERRLARWILLYHDRVSGDEISMTHEEFRLMLAVRRSSITDALHRLEETRAIRSVRGRVIVRDRDKLLEMAAMTYGPPEEAYARLVGTPTV